jgi:peptidoglycan/LPS O-acetylase OafA/YrhL
MSRNKQLDSLRALSILLVIGAHLGFQSFIPGGLGVTFFFTISGYIILALVLNETFSFGNFDILKFYKRRFWKIAPPLFFIIFIPSICFWKYYDIAFSKFISQYFFVYNWVKIFMNHGNVFPPSGIVWSLSIEEQFYIIIAVIILIILGLTSSQLNFRKLLIVFLALIWATSTFLRILISFNAKSAAQYDGTENLSRIYFGTDTRASSICVGGILALLFDNPKFLMQARDFSTRWRAYLPVVLATFLFSSLLIRDLHFRDTFRYTLQEIFISILIATGPVLNIWPRLIKQISESSPAQIIGKSSYCLYLSHPLILFGFSFIHFSGKSTQNHFVWIFLEAILCLSLGIVAHQLFDKPFEKYRIAARRV